MNNFRSKDRFVPPRTPNWTGVTPRTRQESAGFDYEIWTGPKRTAWGSVAWTVVVVLAVVALAVLKS